MRDLTEEEQAIVDTVREFVDRDVRPVVRVLEHANEYPEKLIEQMKQLGIFGLAVPEPYGEVQVSTVAFDMFNIRTSITREVGRWIDVDLGLGS